MILERLKIRDAHSKNRVANNVGRREDILDIYVCVSCMYARTRECSFKLKYIKESYILRFKSNSPQKIRFCSYK